jgi:methyltransferase-like protein
MVRDLVRYHARGETLPAGRVARTRGFLDELSGVLPNPSSPYAAILRSEAERLAEADDSYLVHEVFEEENRPCTVQEFLDRARGAGLEFVSEAETPGLLPGLPEPARAAIGRWATDVASREQYLDVVVNRAFRRSVLRRADGTAPSAPSPDALTRLSVRAIAVPASPRSDAAPDDPAEFRHPGRGGSVSTNNPYLKAALRTLCDEAPRAVPFEGLWERVRERLTAGGRAAPLADEEGRAILRGALLRLFLSDLVDLHVRPPLFAATVSERPVASPLARLQAEAGAFATSLLRRTVRLDELTRAVLVELDGSRTAEDVLEALVARVVGGELELSGASGPVREEDVVRPALAAAIRPALERLAGAALLAG